MTRTSLNCATKRRQAGTGRFRRELVAADTLEASSCFVDRETTAAIRGERAYYFSRRQPMRIDAVERHASSRSRPRRCQHDMTADHPYHNELLIAHVCSCRDRYYLRTIESKFIARDLLRVA